MIELYQQEGLDPIPRLLGSLDTNKLSSTYGCLDRNFWHYKTTDFPSGFAQYGVWPLAIVYSSQVMGSSYYQNPRLRELIIAAIQFSRRFSHPDGSCDHYYPFERAAGATAFALLGCSQAYRRLGLSDKELDDFFRRRAEWIIHHREPILLANHQALMAAAVLEAGEIIQTPIYRREGEKLIEKVLSLQSKEGWYREYGGCDPGYLTLTVTFLAKCWALVQKENILESIERALQLMDFFLHKDGSYGYEYGSRYCGVFLLEGLERVKGRLPIAGSLISRYIEGFARGKNTYALDEQVLPLICADRLAASLLSGTSDSYQRLSLIHGIRHLPEAKLYIQRNEKTELICSLGRGGVFKAVSEERVPYSDCGLVGRLADGRLVMTQSPSSYLWDDKLQTLLIKGRCLFLRDPKPTPGRFLLLRLLLFVMGRIPWLSSWIKKMLTQLLILDRREAPIRFERLIRVSDGLEVIDRLESEARNTTLLELHIARDLVPIYVAGSRYYQETRLQDWIDLKDLVREFNRVGKVEIKRTIYSNQT